MPGGQQNQQGNPVPFQNVDYHGAAVSAEIKAQLQAQPAGDFLRFSDQPDANGNYMMQAKLPEKGRDKDGNEYDIRVNMNYLVRGIANYIMNKDGTINVDRATNGLERFADSFRNETGMPKEMLEACNVPEARKDDFLKFVQANSTIIAGTKESILAYFKKDVTDYLMVYQLASQSQDPLEQKYVRESFVDVQNIMEGYRKMRDMNPEAETEILYPMDCITFARQMNLLHEQSYRRANKGAQVGKNSPFRWNHIQFNGKKFEQRDQPANNKYMAFEEHEFISLDVALEDGQNFTISLENTAPPIGKLVHRPEIARTGVGIYPNVESIVQYHVDHNMVDMKPEEYRVFAQLKKLEPELEKVSLAEMQNNIAHMPVKIDSPSTVQNDYSYQQYLNAENAQIAQTEKMIDELIAQNPNRTIDKARLSTKALLGHLTKADGEYTAAAKGDAELTNIINKVNAYARMNVTALRGNYRAERAAINKLKTLLDTYMAAQEGKMLDAESDTAAFRTRYLIGANLKNFLGTQTNGSLHPEHYAPMTGEDFVDGVVKLEDAAAPEALLSNGTAPVAAATQKAIVIDGRNPAPTTKDRMIDARNMPLFPHDPSPNDISQGYLGDCYMVAGLSTVASRFPEKIRECMVDNGDGTVTVRFFQKNVDDTTGKEAGFTPVLVTVDKIYPSSHGAEDCLWVQMMERAYAASGLHLSGSQYSRAVPPTLQDDYKRLKDLPPDQWPTREENPWLIDENNQLRQWQPAYEMIEGGDSGIFLQQFFGPGAPVHDITLSDDLLAFKKDQYEFDVIQHRLTDFFGKDLTEEDLAEYTHLASIRSATGFNPSEFMARVLTGYKGDVLDQDLDTVDLQTGLHLLFEDANKLIDPRLEGEELFNAYQNVILKALRGEAGTLVKPDKLDPQASEDWDNAYDSVKGVTYTFISGTTYYQNHREEFIRRIADALGYIAAVNRGERGSGVYTSFEEGIARNIDERIKRGNILGASTTGTSDKVNTHGLFGNHAYSVLGISKRRLVEPDGPELTFVKVRNPHGQSGRIYKVKNGKVKAEASKMRDSEGVFDVELGDFCREFSYLTCNELSPELLKTEQPLTADQARAIVIGGQPAQENPAPAQENPAPEQGGIAPEQGGIAPAQENPAPAQENPAPAQKEPEVEERLTLKKLGQIGRDFRKSLAALNEMGEGRFSSTSPEYESLIKKTEGLLENRLSGDMRGKTLTECSGYFYRLGNAADAYLKHCEEAPRSGERRALRMKEATRISVLARAYEYQKDPAEELKYRLAEMLRDEIVKVRAESVPEDEREDFEKKRKDVERRAKGIETVKNSETFRIMTDGKDFDGMLDLLLNRKKALRELVQADQQFLAAQKAAKKAPQPAAQKGPQAEQKPVERTRSNSVKQNAAAQNDQRPRSNSVPNKN